MGLENSNDEVGSLLSVSPQIKESDGLQKLNEATEKFHNDDRKKYLEMEEQFVELLTSSVKVLKERESQKGWLKSLFFVVIMSLFVVLMLTPVVLLYKFSGIINNFSVVIAVIASLIELVAAIMVLPNIIANYLYSKEADDNFTKVISELREYHEKRAERFE